jgi:hypothetical protein
VGLILLLVRMKKTSNSSFLCSCSRTPEVLQPPIRTLLPTLPTLSRLPDPSIPISSKPQFPRPTSQTSPKPLLIATSNLTASARNNLTGSRPCSLNLNTCRHVRDRGRCGGDASGVVENYRIVYVWKVEGCDVV